MISNRLGGPQRVCHQKLSNKPTSIPRLHGGAIFPLAQRAPTLAIYNATTLLKGVTVPPFLNPSR